MVNPSKHEKKNTHNSKVYDPLCSSNTNPSSSRAWRLSLSTASDLPCGYGVPGSRIIKPSPSVLNMSPRMVCICSFDVPSKF